MNETKKMRRHFETDNFYPTARYVISFQVVNSHSESALISYFYISFNFLHVASPTTANILGRLTAQLLMKQQFNFGFNHPYGLAVSAVHI